MAKKKLPRKATYEKLLQSVHPKLKPLEKRSQLQLTSIGKAIEHFLDDKVKIIFCPLSRSRLGEMFPAVLVNQELQAVLPGQKKPIQLLEHFIFYAKRLHPTHERFALAHELGHVYLHHEAFLKTDESQKYVAVPLADCEPPAYAVKFTSIQEMEADLFAAALTEQRHAPTRRPDLAEPCIRFIQALADLKWLESELATNLPKVELPCLPGQSCLTPAAVVQPRCRPRL